MGLQKPPYKWDETPKKRMVKNKHTLDVKVNKIDKKDQKELD